MVEFFKVVRGLFGCVFGYHKTDGRPTLIQLEDAAESDDFDRLLAEAGLSPLAEDDELVRRKWSELQAFDRNTFDPDAYMKSFKD